MMCSKTSVMDQLPACIIKSNIGIFLVSIVSNGLEITIYSSQINIEKDAGNRNVMLDSNDPSHSIEGMKIENYERKCTVNFSQVSFQGTIVY